MTSPNTTSDKLDEILGEITTEYRPDEDYDVVDIDSIKTAKSQLIAYFKTEMNKLIPEEHNAPLTPEFSANDDGFNQAVRQIRESLDNWGVNND